MTKWLTVLSSLAFVLVMVIGGVAFWFMPKKTVSEDENRTLLTMPIATQQNVLEGKYFREFEEYYNDHFPLRDDWMVLATDIKQLTGRQSDEFRVIAPPLPSPAQHAQTPKPTSAVSYLQELSTDTAPATEPMVDDADFSKIKGVIVVNGRVVQNFGGSKATLTPYVKMLAKYRQNIAPDIRMYAMLIPAGADFYLPKKVSGGVLKEKENFELFASLLDSNITNVDAYGEMEPHKNEYIMYRTDHHWTGLGAYYAYRAMAKVAGFAPLELDAMQLVKADQTFLGSLYKYTRDESLKKHPDVLEYYKIPTAADTKTYVSTKPTPTDTSMPWVLYYEKSHNYGVFLGGDHPLIKIISPNQSGRKLLLVKDSFGNALAPYFASHFDEVYVVDYRYYKGGILKLIGDRQITDVLYAYNAFAANSDAVVKLGTAQLK